MTVPERYRVPIVALVALVLVVAVGGAILLVGGGAPASSSSPSASAVPSPIDPGATPESAVRAFFAAFAGARKTDEPTTVLPFVTSTNSSAYETVDAFLRGQKQVGKASVITTNVLSDFVTNVQGQTATVTCSQVLGGYDIDAVTGAPRESPTTLPATRFTIVVKEADGRWLVDSFEAMQ